MMKQIQEKTAINTGGKYYPRKMAHGWCVAHYVTVLGVRIEHFGAKSQSYHEAFERAERMNREEAATELRAEAGTGKEVQV